MEHYGFGVPVSGGATERSKADMYARMEADRALKPLQQTRKAGLITERAARLMSNLDALDNAVAVIEERLAAVLNPETGQPASGAYDAPDTPATTQLAQVFGRADERVLAACNRLHRIADRIDI